MLIKPKKIARINLKLTARIGKVVQGGTNQGIKIRHEAEHSTPRLGIGCARYPFLVGPCSAHTRP